MRAGRRTEQKKPVLEIKDRSSACGTTLFDPALTGPSQQSAITLLSTNAGIASQILGLFMPGCKIAAG